MRSIFGLICRGLFEGGGFCGGGVARPAQWWKCSALTLIRPLWSHRARLAAEATSCGQGVMDLSVVPLRALLKVVGLAVRGVHVPLSGGIIRC